LIVSFADTVTQPIPAIPSKGRSWTLYIVRCNDATLYTGITNDPARRLCQHNEGSASRYTRGQLPVKLVYRESCDTRSAALVREAAVKALSRKEKERLIVNALSGSPA
jgi:putative endonuclease